MAKPQGVNTAQVITMGTPQEAAWVMNAIRPRIRGKVVVEIGAGTGVLARLMAEVASRVLAVEPDPDFFRVAVSTPAPPNLVWVHGLAQQLPPMCANVAVCVTGSDVKRLRRVARRLAPKVIFPWQDYRNGRAIVSTGNWSRPTAFRWQEDEGGDLLLVECDSGSDAPNAISRGWTSADAQPQQRGLLFTVHNEVYRSLAGLVEPVFCGGTAACWQGRVFLDGPRVAAGFGARHFMDEPVLVSHQDRDLVMAMVRGAATHIPRRQLGLYPRLLE